jgi:hypothetical protein
MGKSNVITASILGILISVVLILLINVTSRQECDSKWSFSILELAADDTLPDDNKPHEVLRASDSTGNIPAPVCVEAGRDLLCIFTIIFDDKLGFHNYQRDIPQPLTKLFFVLFRTFISPNAP